MLKFLLVNLMECVKRDTGVYCCCNMVFHYTDSVYVPSRLIARHYSTFPQHYMCFAKHMSHTFHYIQ